MGCGSNNSEITITDINGNNLQEIGINLKESLVLFFSRHNSSSVNIGIYSDIIYIKKKGREKIIKCKNEKFFLESDKKKVINNSILKKYYELYPQNFKYSSVGIEEKFSPNYLLNHNFEKVFETLGIKFDKINENKFAICFQKKGITNENFSEIKNMHTNCFYIYKNKNINDEVFIPYENYILFFKGKNIDFWLENKFITKDNFNSFLNYKENNNNTIKEIIENYIKENKEKEFKIYYKFYEIYNKEGTLILTKTFPLVIISDLNNNNENIIYINPEKKVNITDYILNEIKSNFNEEKIVITKIEIFKERVLSFLLNTFFVNKKKYTLYISSVDYKSLIPFIEFIELNINKKEDKIYKQNLIENIIIMPQINSKFYFFEENKFIYIIMNDSVCFTFAKTLLKQLYKDIYGNNFIKFICVIKNKNMNVESDTSLNNNNNNNFIQAMKSNEEVLYISEDTLINKENNNLYEFYIHSFNDINYYNHILLITNQEGIITYTNYFNNRAQIFKQLLTDKNINIKQGLDLIDINQFKKVKNFFDEKCKIILNNINNIYNENIIEIGDESIFPNFYDENIFHQPYLSLKYNKVISLNPSLNQKFYKNYTINYIQIEKKPELNFDINEHKCLNEISYIYQEKDTYIEFNKDNKDLRCKKCYYMINKTDGEGKDKYIFYLCPISKDIICKKCYHNINYKYEESYPYNLLYFKCKDLFTLNILLKDNISLFKERLNYLNHLEIFDEKCDLCNGDLCSIDSKKKQFYILIRIIRKNYFLICNKCFEILIKEDKDWIMDEKYSFINSFVINYFIDLDNLIFKVVGFKRE